LTKSIQHPSTEIYRKLDIADCKHHKIQSTNSRSTNT